MKSIPINEIENVIKTKNVKNIKKTIGELFLSKGLNRKKAVQVFAEMLSFNDLTINEKICFVQGIFNETKDEAFDPRNYFTKQEMNNYFNLVDDEYIPVNIDTNDERIMQKIEFINSCYGNATTKDCYFDYYKLYIKEFEDNYWEFEYDEEGNVIRKYLQPKDICEFTSIEITNLMHSVRGSISTKNNVLSFITKYLNWCHLNGYIDYNPMLEIEDTSKLIIIERAELSLNYISLKELYKDIMWMIADSHNQIYYGEVAVAMLIRNGITIDEIVKLRYDDIDFDNETVEIKDSKNPRTVELDSFTIKAVLDYKNDKREYGNNKITMNIVDGYIVKTKDIEYSEVQAKSSIRKMLSKFKQFGYRAINENMLISSCKIDMLDEIRNEKGGLITEDYKYVQEKFGNSANSYFKLKTEYEMIRK